MNFCYNCGKKLLNGANFCDNCGAKVGNFAEMPKATVNTPVSVQAVPVVTQAVAAVPQAAPVTATAPKRSKSAKSKKLRVGLIVSGAVVLVAVIVLSVLFVPRNLKMDSFKKVNTVSAVLKYGLPTEIEYNEGIRLTYKDKIEFYGIPVESFVVLPEKDRVALFFDEDDTKEVERKIRRYCNLKSNTLDLGYFYKYKDIEVSTISTYSYVSIEY